MPQSKPSALEDHLGYWLRSLSNGVSHAFQKRLEVHDISVAQWVVLRIVQARPGISLKELAADVVVDAGALSRMVERLMARQLLVRQAKAGNRREVEISLTETGSALVPKLAREADLNEAAFFSILSERQRQQLLRTIKSLLVANDLLTQGRPTD